jgi:hypothetical protein
VTTRAFLLLAVLAVSACRCDDSSPVTPGDGAPEAAPVSAMADPYDGLPPRGAAPALDRAALVLDRAGQKHGYGTKPSEALRARAGEAWTKRLVLFLDHGGTEQLEAAWTDVLGTCVESPGVDPETKLKLRQAEARVLDARADLLTEPTMRKRLLSELAWTLVLLGPPDQDAGPR